jgi:hypothetical protein
MATAKKYSEVYYWRYVFTPILILLLAASMFVLFTLPDAHAIEYSQLISQPK